MKLYTVWNSLCVSGKLHLSKKTFKDTMILLLIYFTEMSAHYIQLST